MLLLPQVAAVREGIIPPVIKLLNDLNANIHNKEYDLGTELEGEEQTQKKNTSIRHSFLRQGKEPIMKAPPIYFRC